MARNTLRDPLRDSNFWLFDIAPIDAISLPIFLPLTGFNTVSAPEISVETTAISQGNDPYPTHVVKEAGIGAVTLTRGVTFYDSDFWRWITAAISGNTGGLLEVGGVTYRRSLLLVHFFRNTPFSTGNARIAGAVGAGAFVATAAALSLDGSVSNQVAGGVVAAAQLAGMAGWTQQDTPSHLYANNIQIPNIQIPARAFLLRDCIPISYRTGSDFDASSGQVSIQELQVQPQYVEEIALAA